MSGKEKRLRGVNFMWSEKELLLSLVQKFLVIVETKRTDAATLQQKAACWERIAAEFAAMSPRPHRPSSSLRKLWENMKKSCRSEAAKNKLEIFKTGGGSANVMSDPLLALVRSLITPTVDRLVNDFAEIGCEQAAGSDNEELCVLEEASVEGEQSPARLLQPLSSVLIIDPCDPSSPRPFPPLPGAPVRKLLTSNSKCSEQRRRRPNLPSERADVDQERLLFVKKEREHAAREERRREELHSLQMTHLQKEELRQEQLHQEEMKKLKLQNRILLLRARSLQRRRMK